MCLCQLSRLEGKTLEPSACWTLVCRHKSNGDELTVITNSLLTSRVHATCIQRCWMCAVINITCAISSVRYFVTLYYVYCDASCFAIWFTSLYDVCCDKYYLFYQHYYVLLRPWVCAVINITCHKSFIICVLQHCYFVIYISIDCFLHI